MDILWHGYFMASKIFSQLFFKECEVIYLFVEAYTISTPATL